MAEDPHEHDENPEDLIGPVEPDPWDEEEEND